MKKSGHQHEPEVAFGGSRTSKTQNANMHGSSAAEKERGNKRTGRHISSRLELSSPLLPCVWLLWGRLNTSLKHIAPLESSQTGGGAAAAATQHSAKTMKTPN